ncbi:hypothetical protein CDAR_577171 [Caerostris darwini]|uniref:Uncharacterized protein n=1 Tax=Caerostris darwini TaxID=1538125 RepID=A0AAV4UGJ0_9ARAC|nr:hypothetical protein CDAR_577171 [Caerostris darwini]
MKFYSIPLQRQKTSNQPAIHHQANELATTEFVCRARKSKMQNHLRAHFQSMLIKVAQVCDKSLVVARSSPAPLFLTFRIELSHRFRIELSNSTLPQVSNRALQLHSSSGFESSSPTPLFLRLRIELSHSTLPQFSSRALQLHSSSGFESCSPTPLFLRFRIELSNPTLPQVSNRALQLHSSSGFE